MSDLLPRSGIREGGCLDPQPDGLRAIIRSSRRQLDLELASLVLSIVCLLSSVLLERVATNNVPVVIAGFGALAGVVAGKAARQSWRRAVATLVTVACFLAAFFHTYTY